MSKISFLIQLKKVLHNCTFIGFLLKANIWSVLVKIKGKVIINNLYLPLQGLCYEQCLYYTAYVTHIISLIHVFCNKVCID